MDKEDFVEQNGEKFRIIDLKKYVTDNKDRVQIGSKVATVTAVRGKVGEQDIVCPHCRRTYAVEYDQTRFIDPEVQLKAKDIQLKLMDDYMKARSFSKVFFVIVLIIMIGMTVFGIFMYINAKNGMEQQRQKFNESFINPAFDEFTESNK